MIRKLIVTILLCIASSFISTGTFYLVENAQQEKIVEVVKTPEINEQIQELYDLAQKKFLEDEKEWIENYNIEYEFIEMDLDDNFEYVVFFAKKIFHNENDAFHYVKGKYKIYDLVGNIF